MRHQKTRWVQEKPCPPAARSGAAAAAVILAVGDDRDVPGTEGQNLRPDIKGAGPFETAADFERIVNVKLRDRLVIPLPIEHDIQRKSEIQFQR